MVPRRVPRDPIRHTVVVAGGLRLQVAAVLHHVEIPVQAELVGLARRRTIVGRVGVHVDLVIPVGPDPPLVVVPRGLHRGQVPLPGLVHVVVRVGLLRARFHGWGWRRRRRRALWWWRRRRARRRRRRRRRRWPGSSIALAHTALVTFVAA